MRGSRVFPVTKVSDWCRLAKAMPKNQGPRDIVEVPRLLFNKLRQLAHDVRLDFEGKASRRGVAGGILSELEQLEAEHDQG
jgi:hypothetical protein